MPWLARAKDHRGVAFQRVLLSASSIIFIASWNGPEALSKSPRRISTLREIEPRVEPDGRHHHTQHERRCQSQRRRSLHRTAQRVSQVQRARITHPQDYSQLLTEPAIGSRAQIPSRHRSIGRWPFGSPAPSRSRILVVSKAAPVVAHDCTGKMRGLRHPKCGFEGRNALSAMLGISRPVAYVGQEPVRDCSGPSPDAPWSNS